MFVVSNLFIHYYFSNNLKGWFSFSKWINKLLILLKIISEITKLEPFDRNNFKRWKERAFPILKFTEIDSVLHEPKPNDLEKLAKWLKINKLCTHTICERPCPWPPFYRMLGQTHVNRWSCVITSQNGGSTDYIFPLRLGVLQWSRHLFNY